MRAGPKDIAIVDPAISGFRKDEGVNKKLIIPYFIRME
jgi:hypothetical protein